MDTMEIDDTTYLENSLITQVNFDRGNRLGRGVGVGVCLRTLCAVLLLSNIGQFIFYEINQPAAAGQTQANYRTLTQDKENLQNDNNNLTAERNRLQSCYDALTEERRRLQATLSNLTKEKDELQQSYVSSITERDEMKASLSSVQNERDRLQTSYNNSSAAAEQLQTNCSNLQRVKDALSTLITALRVKEVQLESNYTSLWKDKDRLQTRYNTLRREKEQLQANYSRLTTAGEELQKKVNKITAKLRGTPCQTHWTKFDVSCYFVSTLKRNWTESRRACIAVGADLLVVDSSEEQLFVNGLLDKDQEQNAWIGLTDSLTEGVWMWVDGTPVTAAYWLPGQPNDFKNQDCGEYVSSDVGSWNDDGCFAKQHWICEK